MRKFIIALLLMLGVMFLITRFAQLEDIVSTLESGDWRFIALAVLTEAAWLINMGASYQAVYRVLNVNESWLRLTLVAAAANFINIVAPSAGVSGVAVFIAEAKGRDYSTGRATVASTLFVLLDYLGLLCVLVLGFAVLIRRDQVTPPEITAAIILVVLAFVLATLIYLGAYSEQKFGQTLAWMAHTINRLVRPFRRKSSQPYLSEERAFAFAREITVSLSEMRHNLKDLLYPALLSLSAKALLILVLYFVFRAFGVPVSVGTLIAGFSITFLFLIISPTPAGVGIVEGLLTLELSSFYIPLGTAAVLAIAYRGITFWLPMLFGMACFRWVGGGANAGAAS